MPSSQPGPLARRGAHEIRNSHAARPKAHPRHWARRNTRHHKMLWLHARTRARRPREHSTLNAKLYKLARARCTPHARRTHAARMLSCCALCVRACTRGARAAHALNTLVQHVACTHDAGTARTMIKFATYACMHAQTTPAGSRQVRVSFSHPRSPYMGWPSASDQTRQASQQFLV